MRHFYRTDPASPEHYHLVLDSTRMPHDDCVEIILAAAAALRRAHAGQPEQFDGQPQPQ